MNLIIKEEGAGRKSTEEIAGKESKRKEPQCGQRQNEVISMKDMKTSTGEKLHIHPTCNKTFPHSSTLKDHIRTHTGEKPYVCPICNNSFAQSPSRKNHMRTHTGEKPYICWICNGSFAQSSITGNPYENSYR
ncbi:zinc finger protein [Loa loa]|uniref:Zinc finger protein n=1 Tax=Loa loa TaxID=7209 RepID=A0A1I7VA37_LOALO|nr:zinc finger protein [Loa loa]EFO20857.2 zinc finger protein [Loa loa]